MDVQQIIRGIHARIEKEHGTSFLPERESSELSVFRNACGRLFQIRNSVGQMPPGPNTLRGKIGKYLIRVLQRSLFWYTPQIVSFQNESAGALESACNLIGWQLERTAQLERKVDKLRKRLSKLKPRRARVEATAPVTG